MAKYFQCSYIIHGNAFEKVEEIIELMSSNGFLKSKFLGSVVSHVVNELMLLKYKVWFVHKYRFIYGV